MEKFLHKVPDNLRNELIDVFTNIERNYRERRWEPSELNGGKLCEVAYCIIEGFLSGHYPERASKPKNMANACRKLETYPSTYPASMRVQIPRMLISLYDIRNNRGVGHVGGEVNPNAMDALCVLQMAKWVMCELIRVFHNVSIDVATKTIEALSTRELALIWDTGFRKRVLDPKMSNRRQALCLLYAEPNDVHEDELRDWIEHPDRSNFRRDVVRPLHKERKIEYDPATNRCVISPLGAVFVEDEILKGASFSKT